MSPPKTTNPTIMDPIENELHKIPDQKKNPKLQNKSKRLYTKRIQTTE